MDLLTALESLIDVHPPVTRSLRYGNPAFRRGGLLGLTMPVGSCVRVPADHGMRHRACAAGFWGVVSGTRRWCAACCSSLDCSSAA